MVIKKLWCEIWVNPLLNDLNDLSYPAGKSKFQRRFFNVFSTLFRRQIKTVEVLTSIGRRIDVELEVKTSIRRQKWPLGKLE